MPTAIADRLIRRWLGARAPPRWHIGGAGDTGMEQALDDAGVTYTIDRITDAVHGFAPAGERYDRRASELHWERVHSLLLRNL